MIWESIKSSLETSLGREDLAKILLVRMNCLIDTI